MAMAGMRLDIVKLFKLLGDHCRERGGWASALAHRLHLLLLHISYLRLHSSSCADLQ
jgi:hypothetical protein